MYHHDFLPAFLERSLPRPLDITIAFDVAHPENTPTTSHNIQHVIALLDQAANRVERLHLFILQHPGAVAMHLVHFLCFSSTSLKFFELNAPLESVHLHAFLLDVYKPRQCWSDRCPALTHVTCTDLALIIYSPRQITHLCIREIYGRRNCAVYLELQAVLAEAHSLTELVFDGVPVDSRLFGPTLSLPQLRTLSLRCSPARDSYRSNDDVRQVVDFLSLLRAPLLASFILPESNPYLPARLEEMGMCIPSITRLAVAPDSSPEFSSYSNALPNIEELVFLRSDPKLYSIAGLSADAWPNLRSIDLTELHHPPSEHLQMFWEQLYQYGHRRFEAGHHTQILVRLPQGTVPQDKFPLDAGDFMDLRLYTA